jgi:uncharacterized protein involved in high-affinity Fe2+ transport
MKYTKYSIMAIVFSIFTTSILAIVDMVPMVYSDNNDHDISLEQDIELNEKCENGIFGDPKGSVASTITGTCSQHAENNVYRAR